MKLTREQRPDGAIFVRGVNRGMIFWANVPREHTVGSEQYKQRPWLIVSADSIHQRLPLVVAVPISSRAPDGQHPHRIVLPRAQLQVPPGVDPALELDCDGLALTEQVRTLAHERLLDQPVAVVPRELLLHVDAGLRYVLRLPLAAQR